MVFGSLKNTRRDGDEDDEEDHGEEDKDEGERILVEEERDDWMIQNV